jgi:hypothetical protein
LAANACRTAARSDCAAASARLASWHATDCGAAPQTRSTALVSTRTRILSLATRAVSAAWALRLARIAARSAAACRRSCTRRCWSWRCSARSCRS